MKTRAISHTKYSLRLARISAKKCRQFFTNFSVTIFLEIGENFYTFASAISPGPEQKSLFLYEYRSFSSSFSSQRCRRFLLLLRICLKANNSVIKIEYWVEWHYNDVFFSVSFCFCWKRVSFVVIVVLLIVYFSFMFVYTVIHLYLYPSIHYTLISQATLKQCSCSLQITNTFTPTHTQTHSCREATPSLILEGKT